jgi:hypothetical protein
VHDHSACAHEPRHFASSERIPPENCSFFRARVRQLALFAGFALASACGDTTIKLRVPAPDAAEFELSVYPVLLRDCGFPACHGDTGRFFRVFGPGRVRYRPETGLFDEPTSEELELAYERARSMLANENGLQNSALLRKPYKGGHKGLDEWGNNVYRELTEPGYTALVEWARTALDGGTP